MSPRGAIPLSPGSWASPPPLQQRHPRIMMYAVVSFDFLGSSNVAVHALLTDEARARQVFQRVCDAAQRLKQPNKPLVDLLRVDGDELE